jgi:hypothetical protein
MANEPRLASTNNLLFLFLPINFLLSLYTNYLLLLVQSFIVLIHYNSSTPGLTYYTHYWAVSTTLRGDGAWQ